MLSSNVSERHRAAGVAALMAIAAAERAALLA